MKKIIAGLFLALFSITGNTNPPDPRSLPLEQITIEQINIQGQVKTWRFRKVCIDEQAYLIILAANANDPVGISATYKDGKPEHCHIPSIKK
jgi:hypothetical protein